jgi:hypothetical protein
MRMFLEYFIYFKFKIIVTLLFCENLHYLCIRYSRARYSHSGKLYAFALTCIIFA